MGVHPVYLAGGYQASAGTESFCARNPCNKQELGERYPVSVWADLEVALESAAGVAEELGREESAAGIASFLERYAGLIEHRREELVAAAQLETGLPESPRLRDAELPRTVLQLRLAAEAALAASWRRPIIDPEHNIRSWLAALGPVWVIGPNNFPFAYNSVAGGDFAAALTAGNPVIAKGHPLHPTTTRLLGELAAQAASETRLPAGAVQLLYHFAPSDGLRLMSDARLAGAAFTGSRAAGLALKAAADRAGKPFFAEMSSLNPVVVLPGALRADAGGIARQLVASVTSAAGQQCTKPGLVFALGGLGSQAFVESLVSLMASTATGPLFSEGSLTSALDAIGQLRSAGAEVLVGGERAAGRGYYLRSTLLRVTGAAFVEDPDAFQREVFGNSTLVVVARDEEELVGCLTTLEGNLTGSIYASEQDEPLYRRVAPPLRHRVGRLMNNKMPTGVTVSTAMNHGGPFPATTQPHFTAVGLPTSISRFTRLECYDNVAEHRLPGCLRV